MTNAITCGTLATLVSFLAAWLLARLSILALMQCMPANSRNNGRHIAGNEVPNFAEAHTRRAEQ